MWQWNWKVFTDGDIIYIISCDIRAESFDKHSMSAQKLYSMSGVRGGGGGLGVTFKWLYNMKITMPVSHNESPKMYWSKTLS